MQPIAVEEVELIVTCCPKQTGSGDTVPSGWTLQGPTGHSERTTCRTRPIEQRAADGLSWHSATTFWASTRSRAVWL